MSKVSDWRDATPEERGRSIRASLEYCLGNHDALAELFNLSKTGVREILAGDQWRPQYERDWVDKVRRAHDRP